MRSIRADDPNLKSFETLFASGKPRCGQARDSQREFLFGSDLLAAPVLWDGFTNRQVYLPAGDWFDYWTGKQYAGNSTISVPAPLDTIPMFVRAGGFILLYAACLS